MRPSPRAAPSSVKLKLSPILETLSERLVLARQQKMPSQDFLELVLADEVSRREQVSVRHAPAPLCSTRA